MVNVRDIRFRASGVGHIIAGPREKPNELAQGVITNLIDVFISFYYHRREEVDNKYLDKGNVREEDSITLFSRTEKKFYKKNSERLFNDYVQGEPDLFIGPDIRNAEETVDIKSSWSLHTFLRAKRDKINVLYFWQGMVYMWLTGAKKHTIAYCLVNGTANAILREKRNAAFKLINDHPDQSYDPSQDPVYLKKARQIEINHIFDIKAFMNENPGFEFDNDISDWSYDIPMNERVFKIEIERDDTLIEQLKSRVEVCWSWIEKNLIPKQS